MPPTCEKADPSSCVPWRAGRRFDLTGPLLRGAALLLPLACWPDLGRPFSSPKLLLLIGLDLALAAAWVSSGRRPVQQPRAHWWALGWAAAVSISAVAGAAASLNALLLALAPVPIFYAIGARLVSRAALARAVWMGGVCLALVAVLQYCALDPLGWLGWQPEQFASARMRVYGTLGNPDFVAAWLCAALPFCWREIAVAAPGAWSRALRWAAAAVVVAAILATGSRVFALVIPLQAAALALRSRRLRRFSLLAVPAAAGLLYLAPGRPLSTTIQGRLYFTRVTAADPHITPAGNGPGSFEKSSRHPSRAGSKPTHNTRSPASPARPTTRTTTTWSFWWSTALWDWPSFSVWRPARPSKPGKAGTCRLEPWTHAPPPARPLC